MNTPKPFTLTITYNTGKTKERLYAHQSNAIKYAKLYYEMNEVKRVVVRELNKIVFKKP